MGYEKIGIVGAGTMGCDIAIDLASFSLSTILVDIDEQALEQAKAKIRSNFRMYQMMKPLFKSLQIKDVIEKIEFSSDIKKLKNAGLIIENATEDWQVKNNIYKQLNSICNNATLFFVNTSCISITKIGSLMSFPENVIGMHFMNPVPLKNIVEVVMGYHTSEECLKKSKEFLLSIHKSPVVVNDSPGFVANRLSHLFMNEAAFLIQDNIASPKSVDLIFKKGYGHAMGPLETADLIGLDTVVHSLEILYTNYQDPKFRCCPLLKKMVDAGLLGRKSGEGFYQY